MRRIGTALLARAPSPERPIVILSGNDIEHALLGLAAMYVGIPYAPISPPYSLISTDFGKLRHIFDLLTPGLVFAADGQHFARAIEGVVPPDVEVVVTRNPPPGRPATLFAELAGTAPDPAVDAAHARVGPDTIAKFLFTSGSTGMPKGVINTQRMWCSNQVMLHTSLAFFQDEPPVIVDWAPWHHTAGGNHDVGLVLMNGGTMYIDEGKPLPGLIEETVRNLREIAPTWYFTVPKGYEALLPYFRADAELRQQLLQPPQGAVVRRRRADAAGVRRDEGACDQDLRRAHPVPHRARLDRDRALRHGAGVGEQQLHQYGAAAARLRAQARADGRQARRARARAAHHAGLLAPAGADRERRSTRKASTASATR